MGVCIGLYTLSSRRGLSMGCRTMEGVSKQCMARLRLTLSPSEIGNGLTKNGDSSITLISASKFGHFPISSLRLNASLYLISSFISLAFYFLLKAVLDRSILSYIISSSDRYLLGSSSANHGYGFDFWYESVCFSSFSPFSLPYLPLILIY